MKSKNKSINAEYQSIKLLIESFILLILLGSLLLYLPISYKINHLSFINCFFTATSAVCVTGLTVIDTTLFTFFGQTVILCLIQLGALGIMMFATLFIIAVSHKMSIRDKLMFKEVAPELTIKSIWILLRRILCFTLILELIGAGVLFFSVFFKLYNFKQAIFYSVFHAVSAFCNAGFALYSDSLIKFKGNIFCNVTIMSLIVFGGLGFIVLNDLYENIKNKILKKGHFKLRLHTKIVLVTTGILIFSGALFFFILERGNVLKNYSFFVKVLISFFQSITVRTAGFNTVEISDLSIPSLAMFIFFMFIGGAPGSCAGGVKVTTFAILVILIINTFRGRSDIVFFKRSLSEKCISKALTIFLVSLFFVFIFVIFIIISEDKSVSSLQTKGDFIAILFESISAFGTVGLSMGITSGLAFLSKIFLILLMFIGRLGPLTLGLLFISSNHRQKIKYPDETISVG